MYNNCEGTTTQTPLHEMSGFIDDKSGEREAILITNNDGVRHTCCCSDGKFNLKDKLCFKNQSLDPKHGFPC